MEVMGTVLKDEPSSLRPTNVPLFADGRDKGIAEDDYEIGFDTDVDEVRMRSEGFTRVEVRLEGSTHIIVVPMDRV